MRTQQKPIRPGTMRRRQAARALVRAVRPLAQQAIKQEGPHVYRATIGQLSGPPLWRDWEGRVEHYPGINVGNYNVTFGQWVNWYDVRVGLVSGDSLILVEIATDDFVAVEVESNTDPLPFTDAQVYADLQAGGD